MSDQEYWLWQIECAHKEAERCARKGVKRNREVSPQLQHAIQACREKWGLEPIGKHHV